MIGSRRCSPSRSCKSTIGVFAGISTRTPTRSIGVIARDLTALTSRARMQLMSPRRVRGHRSGLEVVTKRLARHRRPQRGSEHVEPAQLTERLGARFGIALAVSRCHELLVERRLAVGGRLPVAEMTGVDPEP